MVMESLSQSFKLAEKRKGIDSFVCGGASLALHILFADDMICISKVNKKSMETISSILKEFSAFFDLQLSDTKSIVVFSKSCPNKHELFSMLGFPLGAFPLWYLGIPIVGRGLRWHAFQELLDQLRSY